ncbi:phosphotransferase family protein [Streptomyces sp. NPDC001351]|uniref:phosphotransferase family protein n=1 Tax=Streptomyces sp. NPDC001351 TaxID=3364564 RepID=UPI00368081E8
MEFRPVARAAGAFQQPLTAEQVQAVSRRAFGTNVQVVSAVELGSGMYNTTYRVDLVGQERPVILRVAPAPERQFRSEHQLMRNEYASLPHLAAITPLLPRVIAADWSHEVIGRDWMIQSHLDGIPAPERLGDYPRTLWPAFFRQMGAITKTVHAVRGAHFGPVNGPRYATWSAALVASLGEIAADLDDAGLDAADIRKVAAVAARESAVLDEITEPRMSLGDHWTLNTMIDGAAPEPTITGIFDTDRTYWSDPASDWTIRMAMAKPDERTAFWETYGPRDESPHAVWRSRIYEARHLGAIRLERHRLGNAHGVRDSYRALGTVLDSVA